MSDAAGQASLRFLNGRAHFVRMRRSNKNDLTFTGCAFAFSSGAASHPSFPRYSKESIAQHPQSSAYHFSKAACSVA